MLEAVRLALAQLAQSHVERAELLRVGDLFVLAQLLAAENEHGVFVHAGDDFPHLPGRERFREIDAACLGGEKPLQRLEFDGHGFPQSALMLLSLMTLAHFAISLRTKASNCSGFEPTTSSPRPASRSRMSGIANTLRLSA